MLTEWGAVDAFDLLDLDDDDMRELEVGIATKVCSMPQYARMAVLNM